jgi:hypothetical protein
MYTRRAGVCFWPKADIAPALHFDGQLWLWPREER